jgi:gliding motility-associated-like protein
MRMLLKYITAVCAFLLTPIISTKADGGYIAVLESSEIEICETGTINYTINFFGDGPYNARIEFLNSETGAWFIREDITNIDTYDNPFVSSKSITIAHPQKITIRILSAKNKDNPSGSANVSGEIKINRYNMPTPDAGDIISNCGYSATLAAKPSNLSTEYYWKDVIGASFADKNDPATTFSAAVDDTYTLIFEQKNGPCVATDETTVILRGSPSGSIKTESEICREGDAQLEVNLNGYGPWEYTISDGAKDIVYNTIETSHFITEKAVGETTFYIKSIKDVNNCEAIATQITGQALVKDITPQSFAGADDIVCGLSYQLNSTGEPGLGSWSGDAQFSEINSNSSVVNVQEYGTHSFTWTMNNKECLTNDIVTITFFEPLNQSQVFAGSDTVLYLKFTHSLDALLPPNGYGQWQIIEGAGSINDDLLSNAIISELSLGKTSLQWTVINGPCPSLSDNMTIEVRSMEHPTGFSPNGDGVNDYFEIPGALSIQDNELIIFDEIGAVVYRELNYRNNWQGTTKDGKQLDDGYYYFVFTGQGISPIKDFLVIKRSIR